MEIDDSFEEALRSPEEIGRRTMALACVYGLSIDIPSKQQIDWLDREGIRSELTPDEESLFDMAELTEQQLINASWRSEAIVMLLWAVSVIAQLPPESEESDPDVYLNLVPPYTADMSSQRFLSVCRARPEIDIYEMADRVVQLHWQVREAQVKGQPCPPNINPGVIKERHHAINWITGYGGLDWDDVTTDT